MELKDLCGLHNLQGVDLVYPDDEGNYIVFKLDNICYKLSIDPDDGYRSYCIWNGIVEQEPKYCFPDVKVFCHMPEEEYKQYLIFTDIENGKDVLKIGTDYFDNYYPVAFFNWKPENLHINNKGGKNA